MNYSGSNIPSDVQTPEFGLDTIIFPNPAEADCPITEPNIIIYADAYVDRVFVMNMVIDQKPQQFSYNILKELIEERIVLKGLFRLPDYMLVSDELLSEKQCKNRDKKMEIIRSILDDLETFLVGSYGTCLIQDAVHKSEDKVARTYIYKMLYRYWRSGSRPNAFLRKPGSGASTNKIYLKKTGPKRTINDGVGRMRNAQDNKQIEKILNKFVMKPDPLFYSDAYSKLLDLYYSDPVYDPLSGEVIEFEQWEPDRCISEGQFRTYARDYLSNNQEKSLKYQKQFTEYKKNNAGLSGNASEFLDKGPGYCYQIDETPLDIELVCEFDESRKKRIGKPTVYAARDTTTKCFVGLYITLRYASAHTAATIVFISFRNKKKFCGELGIEIGENDWIMEGKCQRIMVDNAEFASDLIRSLGKDSKVQVIYNKEGRSDEKGLIERAFKLFNAVLKGQVQGYAPSSLPPYLKRLIRQKALLNINELYVILINYIIIYNRYSLNENIVLDKEMRRDGVKQVPVQAWKWGKLNRAGYLKPVVEEELYLNLLEVGEVTVHRDHIYLLKIGLKYKCEWTLKNGYQDTKKANNQSHKFLCRYMRHSLDYIMIETSEGFQLATLHSKSSLFEHMSVEDIVREKRVISKEQQHQRDVHRKKQSSTRAVIEQLQSNAKQKQEHINANQANSQDIRENRKDHTEYENARDKARFDSLIEQKFGLDESDEVERKPAEAKRNSDNDFARIAREKREARRKQGQQNED